MAYNYILDSYTRSAYLFLPADALAGGVLVLLVDVAVVGPVPDMTKEPDSLVPSEDVMLLLMIKSIRPRGVEEK